jgi:hypothetical protein
MSGNFAVKCAATLLWNQWQVLRGIGGNFRMESVATFARNTHQESLVERVSHSGRDSSDGGIRDVEIDR